MKTGTHQIHRHPPETRNRPLLRHRYHHEVQVDLDRYHPLRHIHDLHHRSIEGGVVTVIHDLGVEDDGVMTTVHIDHGVAVEVVAEHGVVTGEGVEAETESKVIIKTMNIDTIGNGPDLEE